MPSLLARFAANVFWLGRYLERVENLSRVVQINEAYARDVAAEPNWRRLLVLYGDANRFDQHHDVSAPATIRSFYLLDRDNPTSVSSVITQARENARSVRHLISTEMWRHINILNTQITDLTARDIRLSNLFAVTSAITTGCQTFQGIAESTFFRGEPWCFYQIGKFVERADQTTRILDIGYDRLAIREDDALTPSQWQVLLRSVSGFHAYRRLHPGRSEPRDIAAFLLYDQKFPRAVMYCLQQMAMPIRELEDRHGAGKHHLLEPARRDVEFALETGPGAGMTTESLHGFLDELQIRIAALSDAVAYTYFHH